MPVLIISMTSGEPFGVTTVQARPFGSQYCVVCERQVDGVVAVGGGSTTGLAKAIALRTDLPQIVVPTTYAGSENDPDPG